MSTSTTLLNSLLERPADQAAWRTVCERYGPAVYRFARRKGLGEADAEEILADALTTLFEAYSAGRYDRSRGRFKTWVFGIAKNKIRELRRKQRRERAVGGDAQAPVADLSIVDPAVADSPDADSAFADRPAAEPAGETPGFAEQFDADVERTLAWQCLDGVRRRVSPLTYQAFDLYVMQNRPAGQVARLLGIDSGAVYVAKSRVLSRARREFERVRAEAEEI